MMLTVESYSEKVNDTMRLKGSHFDPDSSKSSAEFDQFKCTLTRPVSTDESSEDDDMFQLENESEDGLAETKHEMLISEFYTSVAYGFQLENKYKHEKTNADIMAVVYNSRLRGFVILDTRGIVTCKLNRIVLKVERVLLYPKYEHRIITMLQYVRKYNCYFVLDKDFIVKVLNKDFEEVYSMDSETIGASFMVFNSVTDELFTGGVGGTKIWQFHKISAEMFNEIKHLSNYRLTQKTTLPRVGGSWVQKIQVNPTMKHLYCCSEMSVHVYNMHGKLLYHFEQAHTMTITGCCYCYKSKVFATSSLDATVKVWGLNGSLLHTFHGHSKPISNLILHPKNPLLLISSSFDGTIKIWSLETLDQIYSLPVYASVGPMWMFLTDENMISVFNPQEIKLWSLNHFINFWNLTRSQVFHMSLQYNSQKSTRLMAVGTDSSLRLFSRKTGKKLCTVLPPPCVSPLERLLDFCYSRELNLVYLLLNPDTIWIYTSSLDPSCSEQYYFPSMVFFSHYSNFYCYDCSFIDHDDPACRLAKWDTRYLQKKEETTSNSTKKSSAASFECWVGDACQCTAICILTSTIVMTTDAGQSCPDRQEFLLLGLEDGRVLFMDLIIKGLKYLELKASKDAVTALHHDKLTHTLVTKCQLNDHNLIKIWSLPHLNLQFNIPCALNLTSWTRLEFTLLTGYKDGHLFWHKLIQAEDYGSLNTKMFTEQEPDLKAGSKPVHQAEILNVDSCLARLSLCSCSSDGNIKIWEKSGTLIREIILDDSLGSICFLNDLGDLLVSFRNHIFCIPHSKVCLHPMSTTFETSTSSAEESDIYEDPSIATEGLITNRDETEGMKSYLTVSRVLFYLEKSSLINSMMAKSYLVVPYKMDFSKYFLPGRLSQMTAEVAQEKKDFSGEERLIEKLEPLEENDEVESTEMYLSPRETLSKSPSPTSFLCHTEKLDSVRESDYPTLDTSLNQSDSPQLSRSNPPIEEIIKDQELNSEVQQEEIAHVGTEISESQNTQEGSSRSHVLTATDEFVPPVMNSTITKECPENAENEVFKDELPDLFAERPRLQDIRIDASSLMQFAQPQVDSLNKEGSTSRSTIKETNTSQNIKRTPVTTKKKTKKKFAVHPKRVNKQGRRCKEDLHGKTDNGTDVFLKNIPETTSLSTAEEYSSQKISLSNRTSDEEPNMSGRNKLQEDTKAVHYSEIQTDIIGQRRNSQTIQKGEKEEKGRKGKRGNPKQDEKQFDTTEHRISEPPEDSCIEITESKMITKTKGNNSLEAGQEKLSLSSKNDLDSNSIQKLHDPTELNYSPITVKIMPIQSKHHVKENQTLEPLEDPHIEITESKMITRTKGYNSLEPGQEKLSSQDDPDFISIQDPNDQPELNYTPITVKITPVQSKDHIDNKAINKESFSQSKSHSVHHSSYSYSQTQQTDFDIRLDKFATKFSRRGNNAKVLNLLHGRDENTFGEDWYEREIERHHLRHMQRNLRLKSAERLRQMSSEMKIDHKRDFNENSIKIMATSQVDNKTPVKGISENRKIISNQSGKFSSQETIHSLRHFSESKNSVIFKKGKGVHLESSRCKSAPVFTNQNKSEDKSCYRNVSSSARSKIQQSPNMERSEAGMSNLHENILEEQEIFTDYRLSFQKSEKTSPRRPRTSCSRVSSTRKYHPNNTSFTPTKSIPENSKMCKMIVFGNNMTPKYRFPSPLEVRLLNERFPQMCTRIFYHHFTQPYLPNRRITSAPPRRRLLPTGYRGNS